MKLSISNIAWPAADDESVYALLAELGYDGIDIAPGRVFKDPFAVTPQAIKEFKASLLPYNLKLGGMQSLIYQKNHLTIFDTKEQRQQTREALKAMINLGAALEVKVLVFGSPKNRLIGSVTEEKQTIARDFFAGLGDYAQQQGIVFALEPNPAIYGGDFLLTTNETMDFVASIGTTGLKLNLDVGALMENNELDQVLDQLPDKLNLIGHVHLSRPHLKPIVIEDQLIAVVTKLKEVDYKGWAAIEMLTDKGANVLECKRILQAVREIIN